MPASKDSPPDNVIALSRYRAQLGRGKRLRRSEAIMNTPNPEATIRALPGDELYYVVHETGPRDALDILVHATPSQLQVVMDFALWERDDIPPARLAEWLEVLSEAPPEKIGEWIGGLDVELVGLLLLKTSTIYDLSEGDPPDEPEGSSIPRPTACSCSTCAACPRATAPRKTAKRMRRTARARATRTESSRSRRAR